MPQIDLGKIVGDPGPQGPRGLQGNPGEKGETGSPGPGVAAGGAANQVLVKHSGTNFDTMWVDTGSLPVFAGVQYAVAIVADGDTHPAIADGQFVYVRNHSTMDEGLYKASEAISENGALSTSNLTADSAGGLNDLQAQVTTLNDKIAVTEATLVDSIAIVANGDTHAAITSGQYVYVKNHGSLADGLYKATAAIGTNATLSTSNLTADGNGGLNDLKGQVDSLNSKIANVINVGTFTASGSGVEAKITDSISKVTTGGDTVSFTANPSSSGTAYVSGFLYPDKDYGGGYYIDTYREAYWYLSNGTLTVTDLTSKIPHTKTLTCGTATSIYITNKSGISKATFLILTGNTEVVMATAFASGPKIAVTKSGNAEMSISNDNGRMKITSNEFYYATAQIISMFDFDVSTT